MAKVVDSPQVDLSFPITSVTFCGVKFFGWYHIFQISQKKVLKKCNPKSKSLITRISTIDSWCQSSHLREAKFAVVDIFLQLFPCYFGSRNRYSYGYLGNFHFKKIHPLKIEGFLFQPQQPFTWTLDHIAPDGIFVSLCHVAEAVLDLRVLPGCDQHPTVRRISPQLVSWFLDWLMGNEGSCVAKIWSYSAIEILDAIGLSMIRVTFCSQKIYNIVNIVV